MLDGRDLRKLPLVDRKECLRLLVPSLGAVRYGDHVMEEGKAFFDLASEQRLEGMVAKRARSVYSGARTRDWIKIKCQRRQEFVIGGYTDPQGSRGHFGALHLGVYDGPPEAPRLVYVSKVGTGFDDARLEAIMARLRPLARATPPFDAGADPHRPRPPLGRAAPRRRGALHRLDRRRRPPPPDLHRPARRQEAPRVPARRDSGGAAPHPALAPEGRG